MRFGKESRLDSILIKLHSSRLDDREQAAKELKSVKDGWTLDEGRNLLMEAVKNFPARKYNFHDSQTDLIAAASKSPRVEYIPLVLENFEKYPENGRFWALKLLASIPEGKGMLPLLNLIRTYANEGLITDLPAKLAQHPAEAKILFPEILKFNKTKIGMKIYHICLTCCEAGYLSAATLEPHSGEFLEYYRNIKDKIWPRQENSGLSWMWEDDYLEWRFDVALLLDLMAFFAEKEIYSELSSALNYSDPRLKLFAAISLLRIGKGVPHSEFEKIAGSAETRNWLYKRLVKLERSELFPEAFFSQKAFAESDMVNWLIFPTELARVPDEIELMKIVSIPTPRNGPLDYYVFRYRTHAPHWAAKAGWTAGIAGPYLQKNAPSQKSYGDTFSSFDPWESKTPEEHVGNIRELLGRWADYDFEKDE